MRAVNEVRDLKWELQHQKMLEQRRLSMREHGHVKRGPADGEVPVEVRRMEVLRRVGLCTA